MTDLEDLISKISTLSINQQRIVAEVVDEIRQENANSGAAIRGTEIGPNTGVRLLPREPNQKFISSNKVKLAIGDRVEVLTTRKTGREGDIAEVTVFNRLYVGIRLLGNGAKTQRASKYLRFIE